MEEHEQQEPSATRASPVPGATDNHHNARVEDGGSEKVKAAIIIIRAVFVNVCTEELCLFVGP